MSLSERMRVRYEAHMKEVRDQNAREDYVRKQGIEQGVEQGIEQERIRINALNRLLAEQNRTNDIIRAAKDEEYQKKLYEEFGL